MNTHTLEYCPIAYPPSSRIAGYCSVVWVGLLEVKRLLDSLDKLEKPPMNSD